jgi:hypothetical protein
VAMQRILRRHHFSLTKTSNGEMLYHASLSC